MKKSAKIVIEKIADANEFVRICSQQSFDIDLKSGRHIVDAKSYLGIFTIDLSQPSTVMVSAAQDGSEDAAVEKFFETISKWTVSDDNA